MSLVINAAPFDNKSSQYSNPNSMNTLSSSKHSHTKNSLKPKSDSKSSHNKTLKNNKSDFKFDHDKIKSMLNNVHQMTLSNENQHNENIHDNYNDDDNASMGDFPSSSQPLLNPPISAGTQKTILREPFNSYDSQLDLNDYSNYGSEHENNEYYKRILPGYNGDSNYTSSQTLDKYPNNDILLKKINYMIHLLEEQHDEKTNNITEEVVLYSFLGVFMIFIVDSFTKFGKYTR